jgi:hypothetical protein
MNASIVIFLFFWAVAMWRNGGLESHLPVSYRVQNGFLSFCLVFYGSLRADFIFWSAFHPNLISKVFYVQSGIFPRLVISLILALGICATVLEINIGFLMAQQRQKARTLALRFIPFLAAIEILDSVRVLSVHAESKPEIVKIAGPIMILFIVGFYSWIYIFAEISSQKC